ncbi:MAG: carbonic anhydrase family protein [Cyclobacteriaceae bacterium]
MKVFQLITLSLLVFASCQSKTNQSSKSAHSLDKEYYALPGLDHGLLQSPINIKTWNLETSHHDLKVNYSDEMGILKHKAHTIEVDFPEGNSLIYDGEEYEFKQFHFHTPAEHQIDGVTYPMEMHMVHEVKNKSVENLQYLVLAVLFKEGKESSFLSKFLNSVPNEVNKENPEPVFIDVEALLLDENLAEYYCYNGSLTTPPYTESVKWFILKKIHMSSEQQIQKINMLEGNNSRHIQALYGRKIEG